MKFDVYFAEDDKVLVFKRGEVSEYGDLPDGHPLYESTRDGDWWDWCDARSDWRERDRIRTLKLVGKFSAEFANDLKAKAQTLMDRYISEGKAEGWGELKIDYSYTHTYRASAAWKDQPMMFTFEQSLKWTAWKDEPLTGSPLRARDNLVMLWGMADAAYELGLNIVFDAEFKVHLYGVHQIWDASFDE